jgi:purine-binding chemotaxis protein CheW
METLLATFHLGEFLCAVPAADVQEVLMEQPRTPTPGSADCITGLINLRGQVVSTLDLRRRLELGLRPDAASGHTPSTCVVVRWQNEVWSLVVDRIGDVIEVAEDLFEPPPDTLRGSVRELITGAYKLDGQLLLMLDMRQLLAVGGEPALSRS